MIGFTECFLKQMGVRDAVSLFIDGFPMEMTCDWLLQIFKGEGEVTDVFVSQKKRENYYCRFGFVRFKELEKGKKAVRNLNGVKIMEKTVKVYFAKYDKSGLLYKGSHMQDKGKYSKAVRVGNYMIATKERRSFKEVVEGFPNLPKEDDWMKENNRMMVESSDIMKKAKLEMINLKGLIGRLVEEIFNSENLVEIKRIIGVVCEEAIIAIQKKDGKIEPIDHRKVDEDPRLSREDEQPRVFWEEDLVLSMRHKDQREPDYSIGPFELLQLLEGLDQGSSIAVGPLICGESQSPGMLA